MRSKLLIIACCVTFSSYGQNLASKKPSDAFIKLTQWHDSIVTLNNSGLYEGELYSTVSRSRYSHQFFNSRNWNEGKLLFRNSWYFDVPMVFDALSQKLILKHPDLSRRDGIAPPMEEISEFHIDGHQFIIMSGMGVYDLLYDGQNLSLMCERRKEEKTEDGGTVYEEDDGYFLYDKTSSTLEKFKSKKDLARFSENSKKLVKDLKQKGARIKMSDETVLIHFVQNFDSVLNE